MGYLDRILEEVRKKTQEALDKEKEKIENEEEPSTKSDKEAEVEIEKEESLAQSNEKPNDLANYGHNWASKQTSQAVEKAIQALEKAKEQSQKEQEIPKVEENSATTNDSLPKEDSKQENDENTSDSASDDTTTQSGKTASSWLKNLLEKREREVVEAIKKAEEKVKNENSQSPNAPEQFPAVDSEEKKDWLSNKTENVVDSTIKELEDTKEKLENGEMEIPTPPQENPPSQDVTPPSDSENLPQEPNGSESDNPDTNGNENQGTTEDENDNVDKDTTYPSVKGETVKQDGVGESEKQTEQDIMSGKTPTDRDGNEVKLPVILPEYELMVYDALSDEEIIELVRSQLEAYKNAGVSSINSTADSEKSSAQSKRGSVEQSKSANARETNELYDQAKNKIDSDMIKRGLARSSIASLLVSNSENARARSLADNDLQYRNALQEIDDKIAQAETKRQKALESFNIEYAVKHAEEVRKLQQERAEKEEEVIKYNNSIKEKLYDDKLAGLKTQETLSKDSSSKSSSKDDEDEYFNNGSVNSPIPATGTSAEKLYNIYRDILLQMDTDDARYELRNDTLYSKTLPTVWYLRLVDEFGR